MTIYSLQCDRCRKINCSKFFNCVHCNIIQCKECLDETNPRRLDCRILKNTSFGIEKTIYCVNHCSKTKKYCGDCGKSFNFLKSCRKCKTFFCSECRSRNSKSMNHFLIEGEDEYNQNLLQLSNFYCSGSCFELDHMYQDEYKTICLHCGEIYTSNFNETECQKCSQRGRVDLDIQYNKKRSELQKKMNDLIANEGLTPHRIDKLVKRYMEIELIKNNFMRENNLTFHDWIIDLSEGANKCFVMYDNCIIRILKIYNVEILRPNILYS